MEMLRSGELDVAMLGQNTAPEAYYDNDFKLVWDVDNAFYEEFGAYYSPKLVAVDSKWAEENPKLLKEIYGMLLDSKKYGEEHTPELCQAFSTEYSGRNDGAFYEKVQKYHSCATFDKMNGKVKECVIDVWNLVYDRGVIESIPDTNTVFYKL
jgi:hypothetical protein